MTELADMSLDELHEYLMDFDGVPDEDVLPSATYPAVVTDVKIEDGEKAPYIALTFKITAGEWKDSQAWHNLTLIDKPFPRRRLKKAATALLGEAPGKVSPIKLAKSLKGKACQIATGQHEYEGEMRTEVKRILPPVGSASIPEADDEALEELFG